jgi:hypothetical protein
MKNAIILGLIALSAFWSPLMNNLNPVDPVVNLKSAVDLTEPSDEIRSKIEDNTSVKTIEFTNEDRVDIAVFNVEFANRITAYDSDVQEANDVYTIASTIYYKGELKGKYPGFGDAILFLIKDALDKSHGNKNHTLSNTEKNDLADNFRGLAWMMLWWQ